MRGSSRRAAWPAGSIGRRRLGRQPLAAPPRRSGVALDADEAPAEPLGHAPVVPVPKKGSSTRRPASARGQDDAVQQRLRLLRRMQPCRRPASVSRSPPLQIGSSQSLRICRSSLSAFMAS
jgi:hypothetical protein